MMATVDVAISGGGAAGATLATVLARRGMDVVLVEREAEFRDRVRGEGLHPWGVAEIHRLGLTAMLDASGANPLPVWQRYRDGQPEEPFRWAEVSVDGHPEFGVFHPGLQEAAISAAAAAGVRIIRPGKVVTVRSGVRPELEIASADRDETIRARLIVGADGRHSATRRAIGARTVHDPVHHRFGGVLVQGLDRLAEDTAYEAPFSGGRVFVLPQRAGRARAYLVTSSDRNADVMADRSGGAAIRFFAQLYPEGSWEGATVAGPIAFFPNADEWSDSIAGEGIVLIGDAAGANDPSVGNGLSLVFRDVRELTDLLLAGEDWQAAVAEFETRRRAYFEVLRAHAQWLAILTTEEGPEAEQRRERVAEARESDPTADGFGLIFARGPDGLVPDAEARRRFFGEA